MNDFSSLMRRVLDDVPPVTIGDIQERADRRRRRRRTGLASVIVVAMAGCFTLLVVFTPVADSTKVATGTATGAGANATPPSPASVTHSLPPGSQATSTIRYRNLYVAAGDDFPAGARPVLPTCADQGCNPVVWTSTDGTHWTTTWGDEATGSIPAEQLVASPQVLLLFDADEATRLWYSTDALHWTPVALPNDFAALQLRSVAYARGRFVAILNNKYAGSSNPAYGQSDTVWTSTDGSTWTIDTLPATPAFFQSLTVRSNEFQINGTLQRGAIPAEWTSTDGATWTLTEASVPSAHGCGPDPEPIVRIFVNADGTVEPPCVAVEPTQHLVVANERVQAPEYSRTLELSFPGLDPIHIAPGQTVSVEGDFGSYLYAGNNFLQISPLSTSIQLWLLGS